MAGKKFTVAICGATGAVGREMLNTLEQRDFPLVELRLLASERSAGKRLSFRGNDVPVEALHQEAFAGVQLALFSPGAAVSRQYAPLAAARGAVVIDNTSAFRMDAEVPLVVPEVNAADIAAYRARRIIANPNCSTIQMVVALKPLDDRARLKRVVVATYQSASGAGQRGVDELQRGVRARLEGREAEAKVFPRPIAFDCLPQIGAFLPDGYSVEERKLMDETRKILHRPELAVSATCVRVPVYRGHCEAVNAEFEEKITAAEARRLLENAPGVRVVDGPELSRYPTAVDSAGNDDVLVGRIREDPSRENTLDLWIVADNLRKGAALNAVQIAEILARDWL